MLHLILREAYHRKWSFLLSILAMVTAVALFVAFYTTGEASQRETTRLMRDIGYNLRIIPEDTDMDRFYLTGFSERTMPEEYVERFAAQKGFSYAHLLAMLQQSVSVADQKVLLTGIGVEVAPPDKKKSSMIFTIDEGTVTVGYQIAQSLSLQPGDTLELFGQSFRIAKCLAETGTVDDIRVFGHLHDVQRLLNMESRINEIKALECVCLVEGVDALALLREELDTILPEAKVIRMDAIATARREQRIMMGKYFAWIMPVVLIVCAVWIGVLAMMNVRERQQEIGVLRALGYGSGKISWIFLGKALAVGILGALIGFGVGNWLALRYGSSIFKVTARSIRPMFDLLLWSLIAAPLFAALSSFIPALVAVIQDPAQTLREE